MTTNFSHVISATMDNNKSFDIVSITILFHLSMRNMRMSEPKAHTGRFFRKVAKRFLF